MSRVSRRFIAVLSILSFILSVCAACVSSGDDNSSTTTESVGIITITDRVNIASELAQCYVRDDLLRIECINPNLDTYSLSIILYSLTTHKIVGEVTLEEGAWQTGWTKDGFYAASLTTNTVHTYDTNCQQVDTYFIPNQLGYISLFAVNEAADTFFLGIGEKAELYLYDIRAQQAKSAGHMPGGYLELAGYDAGYFYFYGEDGLLRLHEDGEYAETVYCNSQPQSKFLDMSIVCEEDSFHLALSADNRNLTVPMLCKNEQPIGADRYRLATTCEAEGILRVYDLRTSIAKTFDYSHVRQVIFANDYMLVNTYDDHCHSIYWIPLNQQAQTTIPFVTQTTTATTMPTTTTTTNTTGGTTRPSVNVGRLEAHFIDAPLIPQYPQYPSGCESVSAVMLLNYWGEDISVDTFIDDYLPKSTHFYSKDGIYYGPSPFEHFIGNPRTEQAYGCMAPVIQCAVDTYYGENSPMQNVSGLTLPDLCEKYVANDQPVLVWVTIGMVESFSSAKWHLEDGSLYSWPANEHCMMLVGYDKNYYYFNDPYTGKLKKYAHWICEDRYATLGQQALVIVK